MPAQVVRGCDEHEFGVLEMASNQGRVGWRAHTHGKVVTLRGEVDVAVADVNLDPDVRVARPELRQQRQQPVVPVGGGNADPQQAAWRDLLAADLAFGLQPLVERLAALLVIGLARLAQPYLPRRAQEEAHAEAFFQPALPSCLRRRASRPQRRLRR